LRLTICPLPAEEGCMNINFTQSLLNACNVIAREQGHPSDGLPFTTSELLLLERESAYRRQVVGSIIRVMSRPLPGSLALVTMRSYDSEQRRPA
jgi:hypothetical protein